MLSPSDALRATGRRRSLPSLRQLYDEYVMQRIENYKNSISREELLRLGGDAVEELQAATEDQFVLTQVLMADIVDQLIRKRLGIKSFRRWKEQFAKLRAAQREPTHWGLDSGCPVVPLLNRVEPNDRVLAVGAGTEACAYLLAAHEVDLRFWAADLGVVERVEQRMTTESLAVRFFACCVPLGGWMPADGAPYQIVVLDTGALAEVEPQRRAGTIARLQEFTAPGGIHVLLPGTGLVPEALFAFYDGWETDAMRGRRRRGVQGAVLTRRPPADPGHETASA